MNFRLAMATIALVTASGCEQDFEEDLEGDEEALGLGETNDAFNNLAGLTVVANGAFAYTDVSVPAGSSAFLSSVGGTLVAYNANPYPYVNAWIGYNPPGYDFYLGARPGGPLVKLGGQGWAFGTNDYATGSCYHEGAGSHSVTLVKPGGGVSYACFINSVKNIGGDAFNSWDDSAVISYSGCPNCVPTLTCTNDAEASAACVPVTASLGSVTLGSSSSSQAASLGAVDWVNGKVCLLHGIGGTFRTNNVGVGVAAYVSGDSWLLSTAAGTKAHVTCAY